jgi:amino acid adenylation domain-containing protein
MGVDELLASLAARGIELSLEGDRLHYRAPEGALSAELRAQIRTLRSDLVSRLREQRAATRRAVAMSWNELGLWLIHRVAPDSPSYNVALAIRLVGSLDVSALRASLQALVDRHAALRSVYVEAANEPHLVVVGYRDVDFEQVEAAGIADGELEELVKSRYEAPFDLSRDSMMRARLFVCSGSSHVLLLVWHHIAVDGRSAAILFDELRQLYEANVRGAPAGLSRPERGYADFAAWQRDVVESARGAQLWEFWRARLQDAPLLNLPLPPGRSHADFQGHSVNWQFAAEATARLRALGASENASLFVVLLAAFNTLLFRYSNQTDIVIGVPTLGRTRPEFQRVVGDFVNTVPLRSDLSGNPTFRELIGRIRASTLEALDHADYPFAMIVRQLGGRREPGKSPLFDVMFNFQTTQRADHLFDVLSSSSAAAVDFGGGVRCRSFPLAQQEGQFDLALEVAEVQGAVRGVFKSKASTIDLDTLRRFERHWAVLIESLLQNPAVPVSTLEILPADERHQLVVRWNDTAARFGGPHTLHGLFEQQAAATPRRVAVADAEGTLTYSQLDTLAKRVAGSLRTRGVGHGARVAIAVERSARMVPALLGILKAGAAYVPLDPMHPRDRLARMVTESDATAVITERALMGEPAADVPSGVLFLEDCLAAPSMDTPAVAVAAEDIAYVIFTSGSTGGPKGVVIPHRAIVGLLHAYRQRFELSADDRWLAITTLTFDPSILEIFGPLSCGGSLYVPARAEVVDPGRLNDAFTAWRPTFMQATPTTWRMLLDAGWSGAPDLTVLVGGEALSRELARSLRERSARVFNVYGPTETTIWATAAQVDAHVTIGTPLANMRAYVLDPHGNPVPIGVPGELHLGGIGVAHGYLKREELTRERFVPDPFDVQPGARMYRTGDLVRWEADGTLAYLGRLDHQVKIRGHRIELGEIEEALERHPDVQAAAATASPTADGDRQLTAYVVPRSAVAAGDLRRFLRDSLPEYMIPSSIQFLDHMPLTSSGKIDRKQLPAVQPDRSGSVVAPRSELERWLVGLWEELLGVHRIGVTDNFFDLGGHSLLAARLCSRLSARTGQRVHLATLFQTPTIAALAERLAMRSTSDERYVIPLQSGGAGLPYFCVPGGGDNPFIFADIARHLSGDRPVYSFRFPEAELPSAARSPRERVTAIARQLVAAMRTVQPSGPYLIGGYCLGGLVSFEMAQELLRSGGQIASLTIFEMYLPGAFRLASGRERIAYHLQHLRSVGWRGRLAFVSEHGRQRLTRIGRRLAPRLGEAASALAADCDYTPRQAHPGRVILFRGRQQPQGLIVDPDMGWRGLASEGVVVHEIDGHHTDAYKEPAVSRWIALLRDELARAEAVVRAGGPPAPPESAARTLIQSARV